MMKMHRYRSLIAASLAAVVLSGCEGVDYPETVPVEGTVLYKGQPVAGANVSFHNNDSPRAAYGVTDDQGHFVLSTFGSRDGAVLGDHVATVSKPGEQSTQTADVTQPPKPEDLTKMYVETYKKAQDAKSTLPGKYSAKETSPLKYTVAEGVPNNFNLELTD